jgi:hypothetical protein
MDDKLPESILGACVTWLLMAAAWVFTHLNYVAWGFAILASIMTIRAARETIKLRKEQRRRLQEEDEL